MNDHPTWKLLKKRLVNLWINMIFCLVLVLSFSQTHAVEPGKTSYTAEAVCAFRAVGAQDPDPQTRNPDHMAKFFVNPSWNQSFPGLGMDFEDAKLAMDRMNNGVFYYVNARTLHMDAMLTQALKAGFKQVVIMGAGFDSRAYRFHETYPKVRFFEIDLPATSADKQKRVQKIVGQMPDWVTFVPIDFNTQTLDEVLGKSGFSKDQKTFYVWEGVTYFISEAGVDSTLRFIAEQSAPGSQVVFDYMLDDVVQGNDYSAYGARRTVYHVALRGEPYVFGIPPRQLEPFVNLRGLDLLSDLGPAELTQRYLIQSDGVASGKIAEFLRIVHIEVPEDAQQQKLKQRAKEQGRPVGTDKAAASTVHRVAVPDDIQTFFDRYSNSLLRKDHAALKDSFSAEYLFQGRNREMTVANIKRLLERRPLEQHRITLTRLNQKGDKAIIDGFVSLKGFRIPLMVQDITKDSDGHWRWYGNQQ